MEDSINALLEQKLISEVVAKRVMANYK
jgi:hypothetical protein